MSWRDGKLQCDMSITCTAEVTHLDSRGYVYCTEHGKTRRQSQPCRKLRGWEKRKLERGAMLKQY